MKPEDWTLFRWPRDPDPPAMSTPTLCAIAIGFGVAAVIASLVLP